MATAQKSKSKSANARKTSTAKKTTTKKRVKSANTTSASVKKLKEPIVTKRELSPKEVALHMEIKLWATLAFAVLLELSNFGIIGKVGNVVSRFMFGMFGVLAYIFPIVLFFVIVFMMVNFNNQKAVTKCVAGIMLLALLCSLVQIMMTGNESEDFYRICSESKSGGGLIGGTIGYGLSTIIGIYGAFIAILFLIIICVIIITEKSLVGGLKKGYNATKGNIDRMKQESEVYKENRNRNKRYNRKASGVAQNLKLSDPNKPNEELHEIHSTFPNSDIYRGPIENSNIDTETAEIIEKPEKKRIVEHEIYEPVSKVKETSSKQTLQVTESDSKNELYEPPEKNEVFTPKEKIEVSKNAKEVMNRKAYAVPNKTSENVEQKAPDMSTGVTTPPDKGRTVEKDTGGKKIFRYEFPPLSLLKKGTVKHAAKRSGLSETAIKLEQILKNFGVKVTVTNESHGPSVTRYELQPEMGTKVSKITSLTDDIKLNLAAPDIRIEAPIPGKAAVGIEVPNDKREAVYLRDLIESDELSNHPSKLAFAAGMDIAGNVIVADIAKMPHMLIAGTTGSGKSVFTNSIIMSILYRADPMEVKMIIVDPKVVEFGVYNGIPHLLTPVVTDPRKAAGALAWAVNEMQDRYNKFAEFNVRDIKGYNAKIEGMKPEEGEPPLQKLPQILIIIDELADLMMVAAKEVESSICRLAQLARAAGIHLVIATQRPSVDVVTGLIKANIPSRVALLVSSGIDSRTIIDINGAEKLLGNGDMLFYPSGYIKPIRVQGAFVSDGEVQSVVEFITSHAEKIEYNEEITNQPIAIEQPEQSDDGGPDNSRDAYFAEAGKFVIEKGKGSTSMLQRMYRIGFNRAARIMDQLAQAGVVGDEEGTKPRKILMTMEEFEAFLQNNQ